MLPRLFINPSDIQRTPSGLQTRATKDSAHHLKNVLRLSSGDKLWVCDSNGFDYFGCIETINKDSIDISLQEPIPSQGEPPYFLTLFQALPKADKMDLIVQKATEVGVSEIIPVKSERSVVNINLSKAENKTERWNRITHSAAAQAGRGKIPKVATIIPLTDALTAWRGKNPLGKLIVPWEEEKSVGLKEVLNQGEVNKEIGLVIGPEGGLSPQEIEVAYNLSGQVCTLGPRILRTETAGPLAAALILYELGCMGG